MTRKTAFTTLTGLALLALAISACTSAQENAGGGREQTATAPGDPARQALEEAQLAGEEDTHGGGHGVDHGAGSDRSDHGQGGTDHDHGPGTGSHGPGNQRQGLLGEEVRDFAITDNTGKAFRLGTLRRTEVSRGKIAVLTSGARRAAAAGGSRETSTRRQGITRHRTFCSSWSTRTTRTTRSA